jgi:hypothetical protein
MIVSASFWETCQKFFFGQVNRFEFEGHVTRADKHGNTSEYLHTMEWENKTKDIL